MFQVLLFMTNCDVCLSASICAHPILDRATIQVGVLQAMPMVHVRVTLVILASVELTGAKVPFTEVKITLGSLAFSFGCALAHFTTSVGPS